MSKNEALFGPHFGPCRPDARFGREDGPACASPIHSAMDERPGSALAGGMTRRRFLATAAAGFGMVVTACAAGCSGLPGEVGSRDFDAAGHASLATIQDSERGAHRISIVMGGDVLAHRGIWMSGERADGTRNYDHLFSAIAPTFKFADIAMVNQETVLGGVEMGLSGFPTFNSPQELGDAEAAAGIDVALAATNHALDKGFEGIEATLRFWRERHPEMLVPGIADSNEAADRLHIVWLRRRWTRSSERIRMSCCPLNSCIDQMDGVCRSSGRLTISSRVRWKRLGPSAVSPVSQWRRSAMYARSPRVPSSRP